MSYQVLARKWRPRQFSELVGQQHVKTALANALTSSRLHHAYLFTGTRGVGKTTIARIFAKSLNCETGVTATPCGQCSACLEIDAGNFVDLLEIDAASRTKVEDTRDLLDNVQYAPSRGRFKVYLIDEVHMLSRHSFNALLKTLEEPPPHVKFLLATTDPQKLPVTVLSRCLQFSLKALTVAQIEQHLATVLQAENIPFATPALTLLAKAAKGSLRDSLSLTDQAIALSNADVTTECVRQMLGLLDSSWSVQLLTALLSADIQQLQLAQQELLSQSSDYQQILDDILSLLHLAALTQLQPTAAELSEHADFIRELALQPAETLQLYYQLLLSGKKDLPFAPDPVIGLEMALLRAMAFVPAATAATEQTTTAAASVTRSAISATPLQTSNPTQQPVLQSYAVSQSEYDISTQNQPEPVAAPVIEDDATPKNVHPVVTADMHEQAKADVAMSGIDSVTARIMARRGVAVPTSEPERFNKPELTPEKKFERPQAPAQLVKTTHNAAVPTKVANVQAAATAPAAPAQMLATVLTQQEAAPATATALAKQKIAPVAVDTAAADATLYEEESDDSVSFAEQQALTEAWWQQQSFVPLPDKDTDELDEQRFSIRFAAQVDAWSRLIEQLSVGGLMRLYLLHSAMQQHDNIVQLNVLQSQQHLDNPEFRRKLSQAISPVFPADFTLQITYQAEVPDSPLSIQQRIELERKDYVSRLMQQDPHVLEMQRLFAAELQLNTLQVN